MLDRRESLALFGIAAGTASRKAETPAAAPIGFDPMDPSDNLMGFVKIMGDRRPANPGGWPPPDVSMP